MLPKRIQAMLSRSNSMCFPCSPLRTPSPVNQCAMLGYVQFKGVVAESMIAEQEVSAAVPMCELISGQA